MQDYETDIIDAKLTELRGRLRRLIALAGWAKVLLAGLGAAALLLALDWHFHLNPYGRIVLGMGGLGAVIAVVLLYLVRPLRVHLTDGGLALLVEDQFPELKERLISAVQLARPGDSAAAVSSRDLLEALQQDARRAAGTVEFGAVVRSDVVRQLWLAAAGALLVATVWAVAYSTTAGVFARRLVNPFGDAQYPKKTVLTVLELEPRTTIARGSDLEVNVKVEGRVPSRVWLYRRSTSASERLRMRQVEEQFKAYFTAVAEDFSFYVEGGDDRTARYSVKVIDRPRVDEVRVSYVYPKYTGLPEWEQPVGQGEINAVVGTLVKIAVTANKRIREAEIRFDKGEPVAMQQPQAAPSGRGSLLGAEFKLQPGPSRYAIHLTDLDGLTDGNPLTFRVRPVSDAPPSVRVVSPAVRVEATAIAKLDVEAEARDDFGVRALRLVYTHGQGAKPQIIPLEIKQPDKQVASKLVWDLATLAPKEGDVISYVVDAEDFCEPQANVGKSEEHFITIITRAQLANRLDARLKQARSQLDQLIREQQANKGQTDDVRKDVAAAGKIDRTDYGRMQQASSQQRRISRQGLALRDEINQVAAAMKSNDIGTLEDRDRVEGYGKELDQVASNDMPQAAASITRAHEGDKLAQQQKDLDAASEQQTKIIERLKALLERMTQTEGIDELIRRARELVIKQGRVNEQAREASIRTLNQTPDQMSKADQGALRSVAREQTGAQRDLVDLEGAMGRFRDLMSEKAPAVAKAVGDALSQSQGSQIGENMKEAAAKLDAYTPLPAVPLQQKILKDINTLLASLEKAKTARSGDNTELTKQLDESIKQLDRLIQEQKDHRAAAARAAKEALDKARTDLDGLIERQEAARDETKKLPEGDADKAKPAADAQDQLAKDAADLADKLDSLARDAAASTSQAAKSMQQAAKAVADAKPQQAAGDQQKAVDKLAQAKKQLDAAANQRPMTPEELKKLAEQQGKTADKTAKLADQLKDTSKQTDPEQQDGNSISDAADNTSEASQQMGSAQKQLGENKPQEATQPQQKAIDRLQEARDELAKLASKLAEKEREKALFEIGAALNKLLTAQRAVNVATAKIDEDSRREGGLNREARLTLQKLPDEQGKLGETSEGIRQRLEKEGIPVFEMAMQSVVSDMKTVQVALAKPDTGWLTQQTQKDIEQTLVKLIEALKEEQAKARENANKGGGGGGGGGGKPPLVPPIAQLKMLKTLQLDINSSTMRNEQEKAVKRLNPLMISKRVEVLAKKQGEVSMVAERFGVELEEAQKKADEKQGKEAAN